jgi:ribosomal protein S1
MQNTSKVAKDLATALTASLKIITKNQNGVTVQSKNGDKFFIPFSSSTTNSSLGRGL